MKNWFRLSAVATIVAAFPHVSNAQNPIPNSSFETWSGGQPTGWYVNNLPGSPATCTQSGDAHGGSSALRGEVVSLFGAALMPAFFAGSLTSQFFPVNQKYAQLTGYYKFSPAGADTLILGVSIMNADMVAGGGGEIKISAAASAYTRFVIDIVYDGGAFVPARANLAGSIGGANGNPAAVGSFFLLDDLEFTGTVTSIADNACEGLPVRIDLLQNYPNPFNPSTTFSFFISKPGHAELSVFNTLGQEVSRVVDQNLAAGQHRRQWDAGSLPAGEYVYRLKSEGQVLTKKLLLAK